MCLHTIGSQQDCKVPWALLQVMVPWSINSLPFLERLEASSMVMLLPKASVPEGQCHPEPVVLP